jgi:hypothetical protein
MRADCAADVIYYAGLSSGQANKKKMMYLETPPRPGQDTDKDTDSFIEGPSFDAEGNLYVVDIRFGRIFKIARGGEWSLVIADEGWPNGLKIAADGRIVVADYKHGLMELDAKAGRMQPLLTARNSESFRGCNDLHLAANGDIYFTDQGQTGLHDPTGPVYRLSANRRLDCLIDTGISPKRSRWHDHGRGGRLARPRFRIRAEWGTDRAHQIMRRSGLHECRDRWQEPRSSLYHGVGDRRGAGRGHRCSRPGRNVRRV